MGAKSRGKAYESLLELVVGFFFGCVVAFTLFGVFFGRDPLQEEIARRGKQAQCKAYEEELMRPQSPEDKMHLSRIYASLCKEVER